MKNYMVRDIPFDLHRRLKVIAAERGITLQQVILEALEQYMEKEKGEK